MKLFTSNKELEARVSQLETELSAAQEQAERATELDRELAETKAGFDAERAEFQTKLDAANADLTTAKVTIEELEKEKAELTEQAKLTSEKVSLEASRQLAAAGHPPIEGVTTEEQADPHAGKSLDELNAYAQTIRNPKEQMAFVKKYIQPNLKIRQIGKQSD